MFKCQPEFGYFVHENKPKIRNFEYNFRLWNACENIFVAGAACYMPELFYSTCPIFPIRVIKTVRFRVEGAKDLLNDPELNTTLKIVVLVRDPRGFMNSRWKRGWCKYDPCRNPTTACKDLYADVLAAYELKQKFPGNF